MNSTVSFTPSAAVTPTKKPLPLKSQLSLPRQRLLELCQRINFGSIRLLQVKNAQPMITDDLDAYRDIKLKLDSQPRPESRLGDFEIKQEHQLLFVEFDRLKNGTINLIEVRYGLPDRVLLRITL